MENGHFDTDPIVTGFLSDLNTLFHLGLTAEGVSRASDHESPSLSRGELLDAISLDMTSCPPTVEGTSDGSAHVTQSEDAEFQALLIEWINQSEEYRTNNKPTNPMFTCTAPGTTPSVQPPSSEVPSTDSHTAPIIRSEYQSYQCSWHLHDSGAWCHHTVPDRPAFLRHLGISHQVSGDPDAKIICQLLDSKTGSACNMPIKRGNFPRHVDIHYPLRYHCAYCPTDKSFSRQDSWKKHMRNKHA